MSHLDDTGHSKSRGQFEKLVRATPDASTTPFLGGIKPAAQARKAGAMFAGLSSEREGNLAS